MSESIEIIGWWIVRMLHAKSIKIALWLVLVLHNFHRYPRNFIIM